MSLIWFLLIGLLVGWLAGVLVQGRGYGVLADIVIGILGAMIGGFLFGWLGIQPSSSLGQFFMAVVGAVLLLAIVKAIHKSA